MPLRSFRSRLIAYSITMMLFLAGTLIYSYRYVHDVIRNESDAHMGRMVQLLNGHLEVERNELQRYATIVSDDLRLKEYMYLLTEIGADTAPLETLYNRLFGWLPIDRRVIISFDGYAFMGDQHTDLINAIISRKNKFDREVFYFEGKFGLEAVALTPIQYRDNILGVVAISRQLGIEWLNRHKRATGGEYFLEKDFMLISNTIGLTKGDTVFPRSNSMYVNDDIYRIFQVDLPGNTRNLPHLWFGLSEATLLARLARHRQFMFTLVVLGVAAILIMGLLIFRDFNRPLMRLMKLTRAVANGKLPNHNKLTVRNEFDELSNQFADMLQALRDKQLEIEETHAKLEQTAITDSLTNLYNRRHLTEIYPKLLAQAQRENKCMFALILDIDHFKKINDSHGHIAGDKCLIQFAKEIKNISRANDFLFRMGGEEFLILTLGESIQDTAIFADKVRLAIENIKIEHNNLSLQFTISCGVSCAKPASVEFASLGLSQTLSQADIALYQAKEEGRNRVCIFQNDNNACFDSCRNKNTQLNHPLVALR